LEEKLKMNFDFSDRRHEVSNEYGTCYHLSVPATTLRLAKHEAFLRHHQGLLQDPDVVKRFPLLAGEHARIFADIESCGLAYKDPIFMISYFRTRGESFDGDIETLLARDYGEERPMLRAFLEVVGERNVVITYNGKTFDSKRLIVRAQRQGVGRNGRGTKDLEAFFEQRHIDLRSEYPGGLQTFEKAILKYQRKGDIPGSKIPEAYRAYVYPGGTPSQIQESEQQFQQVLMHNMVDVASLVAMFAFAAKKVKSKPHVK
jgi:uncharacterized protein YprB with RNaseH-like and TPR domain